MASNCQQVEHGSCARVTNRDRGMTLVEVVIAVTLFGMSIAGVCSLILQSRRLSDKARMHYQAVNIAKSRFELARTYDFSLRSLFSETNTIVNESGEPQNNGYFRRTTTLIQVASNLTEIVITVDIRNRNTWDFTGESEELRSYFADYLEPQEE